uniref:Uncharacterized protein n=1 Tax=Setaria italica TaxID=4555 RepID=K3ZF48_SETIT
MGGEQSRESSSQSQGWQLEEVSRVARELSNQVTTLERRVQDLERKNTELSGDKGKLEKNLEEKTKAAHVLSNQVSTMKHRLQELERRNAEQCNELVQQLEDTRKAGLVFMDAAGLYQEVAERQIKAKVEELDDTRKAGLMFMSAADSYEEVAEKQIKAREMELGDTRKAAVLFMDAADAYQEEAEKQVKAKAEELEDTRKAGLVFMDAADMYQEEAEKQIKAKVEELEGTRKAVLVFMDAADAYQEEAEKQIKAKVEELKVLRAQNVEMDERVENDKLGTEVSTVEQKYVLPEVEVERLKMEEIMEAVLKEFDAEKAEIIKVPEDLKTNGENEKLSEVYEIEQKHSLFEVEVERLKMELGALVGKEAVADAFDVQKEENMKESNDLKRKVEEVYAIKDFVRGENDKLRLEVLTTEQ